MKLLTSLMLVSIVFTCWAWSQVTYCAPGMDWDNVDTYGVEEREKRDALRKAAKEGNARSQEELGNCYLDDIGIWFFALLRDGEGSIRSYGRKDKTLTFDETMKCDEALRLLKSAAKQGEEYSQKILGYMYERGMGVSVDRSRAVEYLTMAAKQGDIETMEHLERLLEEVDNDSEDVILRGCKTKAKCNLYPTQRAYVNVNKKKEMTKELEAGVELEVLAGGTETLFRVREVNKTLEWVIFASDLDCDQDILPLEPIDYEKTCPRVPRDSSYAQKRTSAPCIACIKREDLLERAAPDRRHRPKLVSDQMKQKLRSGECVYFDKGDSVKIVNGAGYWLLIKKEGIEEVYWIPCLSVEK